MSGLFTGLMSLVRTTKKGGRLQPPTLLKVSDIKRSVDDITIPYLLANNTPEPIHQGDNNRYDLTALVFLKLYQSTQIDRPVSITEANYWRSFAPFWNTTDIKRIIWWKYFNEVTIYEAKQIVAREVMDKLYKDIFIERLPVIGIRVVLYNGNTDQIIDPQILRDPWFATTGFNQQTIDRFQLKAWGVRYGTLEQAQTSKPDKTIDLNRLNFDRSLVQYNIHIDDLIRDCVREGERKVNYVLKDQKLKITIKRFIYQLTTNRKLEESFKKFFIQKIERDMKFERFFMQSQNKRGIVVTLIQQIVDDLIDKEVSKMTDLDKKKGRR